MRLSCAQHPLATTVRMSPRGDVSADMHSPADSDDPFRYKGWDLGGGKRRGSVDESALRVHFQQPSAAEAAPNLGRRSSWVKVRHAQKLWGMKPGSPGRRGSVTPSPDGHAAAKPRASAAKQQQPLATTAGDDEVAEAESPQHPTANVGHYFSNATKGYMNLEVSGATDAQMESLAAALRDNTSLESVNLSYNTAIRNFGVRLLARGLAATSTVRTLNLAGCTGITDTAAAELLYTLMHGPQPDVPAASTVATPAGGASPGTYAWQRQQAQATTGSASSTPESSPLLPTRRSRRHSIATVTAAQPAAAGRSSFPLGPLSSGLSSSLSATVAVNHSITHSFVNTRLSVLDLSGCTGVGDAFVRELAASLPPTPEHTLQLVTVNLSGCRAITDAGLSELARSLPLALCLQTLIMQGCASFTAPDSPRDLRPS